MEGRTRGTSSMGMAPAIGFFDHMLISFAKHGFFDLNCKVTGDLFVDSHHTIEDTGIVLGQTIAKRIGKQMEGESSLVLDFGEIKDDESLLTNTFPIPIPKGEYHVLRSLTYGKVGDILAKTQNIGSPGSGEHDHKTFVLNSVHGPVKGTIGTPASGQPDPPDPPQSSAGGGGSEGAHQHHVLVPEKMRSLKPGDRVLVAWVQNEAVVVDIVVSS